MRPDAGITPTDIPPRASHRWRPTGDPLVPRQQQVVGTWRDDSDGSAVLRNLRKDGSFASGEGWGDFHAHAHDLGEAEAPDPGSGSREHRDSEEIETDEPMSEVRLTFTPGEAWTQ